VGGGWGYGGGSGGGGGFGRTHEFFEFGAEEAGVAVGAVAFAEGGDVAGAGVEADVGIGEDLVLGGVFGAVPDEIGAGFVAVVDEEGFFETLGALDVPEFGG